MKVALEEISLVLFSSLILTFPKMKRNLFEISNSDYTHRSLLITSPPEAFSNYKNINPNDYILNNNTLQNQHLPKRAHLLTPKASLNNKNISPDHDDGNNPIDNNSNSNSNSNGYWCQPDLSILSALPIQSLSNVSNFSIGKSNYGKIIFEFPVNLSQFASNWNSLWESVTFSKNLVNVNHINGDGLNVPAIIYLENVSPNPNQLMDDFINQLKSPLGMEFISYDPHSKIWAFKVDHFSVWGLVNDATDPNLVSQFNKQQQKEKLKINLSFYPNNNNSTFLSNLKGEELPGYLPRYGDDSMDADENEAINSINEDNLMQVNEKTIEPTFNDIFKLEKRNSSSITPSLKVDSDWDRQLSLANTNFSLFNTSLLDSPFSSSLENLKPSKVNEMLFKDVVIPQRDADLPKLQFPNSTIYSKIFQFYSNGNSKLLKRTSNGFPKYLIDKSVIDLSVEREFFKGDADLSKIWELISILWDKNFIQNKRDSLCEFIQKEINLKIPVNDPLDSIIEAICKDNLNFAIQLSIETNNYHLATLLTSIGQSQEAAELQLLSWTKDNVIQHIPSQIIWIFKLLRGDYILSESWAITLFLGLKYTNIQFDQVLNGIKSMNDDQDSQFYRLLMAFVNGESSDFDFPTLFLLSTVCGVNIPNFDTIIIELKNMLLDNSHVEESLYVLSFLSDDREAEKEITKVTESYIKELNVIDDDKQLKNINLRYGIPEDTLFIARAKYLVKNGRFFDASWQYINGSQLDISYEVCLEHIAPQYVIGGNNEDLLKLKELLSQFISQPNWGNGGKIYVDYINRSPSLKDGLPFLETKTWHQRVAKTIMLKLLENL